MVLLASPAGIIVNDDPYLQMAWADEEGPHTLYLHCNNELIVVFINRETEEPEVPVKAKILAISLRITNPKSTETLAQKWKK